jgi:hypothetical protein
MCLIAPGCIWLVAFELGDNVTAHLGSSHSFTVLDPIRYLSSGVLGSPSCSHRSLHLFPVKLLFLTRPFLHLWHISHLLCLKLVIAAPPDQDVAQVFALTFCNISIINIYIIKQTLSRLFWRVRIMMRTFIKKTSKGTCLALRIIVPEEKR